MSNLAEYITYHSSLQTYWTIRLLVDKDLRSDCFRAYAYFRWIDDQIDEICKTKKERLNLIARQQSLISLCYQGKYVGKCSPQENLLIELISSNPLKKSKLGMFVLNFIEIIKFDAHRKGRYITPKEFSWYTKTLSIAVTSGIEYFINNNFNYPSSPLHYRAGIGAHLTHMLRDYYEDMNEGYFNIPKNIDLNSWVKSQVPMARKHFLQGKKYISKLPVFRGRLAAAWYCARFVWILDQIEKDHFQLRKSYPRNNIKEFLRFIPLVLKVALRRL